MKPTKLPFWLLPLLLVALGSTVQEKEAHLRLGKDYALFFAVSNYNKNSGLLNLPNSVKDAQSIADVLEKGYGFRTEVIIDPTLDMIEHKLNEYRNKFSKGTFAKDGQLLIFFSGHGVKESNNGYFLPANVEPNRLSRTALAYNIWRPIISEIECQHILVAIDACYSVTFDPTWESKSNPKFRRPGELSEAERILANHKSYKSRIFFTSDAKEDIVPGRSNFARKLLEGLLDNQYKGSFITSSELFANYVQKAQPTPRANHFEGDDPRSSFLFFPVPEIVQPNKEEATPEIDDRWRDIEAYKTIRQNPTLSACQQYLKDFPNGAFQEEVAALLLQLQNELKDEQEWQIAILKDTKAAYETYLRLYPYGKYTAAAWEKVLQPSFIFVKGGTFQMGDLLGDVDRMGYGDGLFDEKPVRSVTVSDFYIGKYEVTVGEFKQFIDASGYETIIEKNGESYIRTDSGSGWEKKADINWRHDEGGRLRPSDEYNYPVMHLSWYDAIEYCNWRSKLERLQEVYTIDKSLKDVNNESRYDDTKWTVTCNWAANGYRLPTEAEWEYAARGGGKKVRFGNGQDIARASQMNFNASSNDEGEKEYTEVGEYRKRIVAVGSLNSPNALGLHDMSGNIEEWCWDWYALYTKTKESHNPRGPESSYSRVVRGGSWYEPSSGCRASSRYDFRLMTPDGLGAGFRLARN